jgi:uncharacterized protein YggE
MSRQSFLTIGLAVALAITLAFALRPLAGSGQAGAVAAATPGTDSSGTRSVSVSGQGQVKVTPDIATITFSVESRGTDLTSVQGDNATRTQAVIDKLKSLGIADTDLQTTGYNVSPQYDKDQKLTGYVVTNGVRAVIRKISSLGATIDAAVGAGANRVSWIGFDVANKADALTRAREAAVADARGKAEQYAKLTGVTLGGPLQISETTTSVPYQTAPAAAPAAGGSATTPIETGQGSISLTVQITYEIK